MQEARVCTFNAKSLFAYLRREKYGKKNNTIYATILDEESPCWAPFLPSVDHITFDTIVAK